MKYPFTGGDSKAMECLSGWCAVFGDRGCELAIWSDSNIKTSSFCSANEPSFNLSAAKGTKYPSINGGEKKFQVKQFEVYSVFVRITINIIFRSVEQRIGESCFLMYF
jgi:hypothetical protein